METRIKQQIDFIIEVDKLKRIYRQNILTDKSRYETDAEHSWHLALMAMILAEHVPSGGSLDVLRVIKMVIIHDLVEIDAGDTYCYDTQSGLDQNAREKAAAARVFPLLPPDQASEVLQLWEEFEDRETVEAKFAGALDRLQPLLLHYSTQGHSWKEHGITSVKVRERNKDTRTLSAALGDLVDEIIEDCIDRGYLAK
jgi:putative hydrolase of HD superfamily